MKFVLIVQDNIYMRIPFILYYYTIIQTASRIFKIYIQSLFTMRLETAGRIQNIQYRFQTIYILNQTGTFPSRSTTYVYFAKMSVQKNISENLVKNIIIWIPIIRYLVVGGYDTKRYSGVRITYEARNFSDVIS